MSQNIKELTIKDISSKEASVEKPIEKQKEKLKEILEKEVIEIKSGEIKERDLASLTKFIEKFHPKEAFILSYNIEKTLNNIKIMPFYKYLLKK